MDIYELTRQGKNICPVCNQPKRMYYLPWCPICEKPVVDMSPTLNFLQALYHLQAIGHTNAKKIIWDYFANRECFTNDSYFTYNFEYLEQEIIDLEKEIKELPIVYLTESPCEYLTENLIALKLLKKLQEVFNLGNDIIFWVSW